MSSPADGPSCELTAASGSLPCFLVDPSLVGSSHALLRGPEAHHCIAVRRLQPGRRVLLIDGRRFCYHAEIEQMTRVQVTLRLLQRREEALPAEPRLVLALALLKGTAMDLVLEKLTEIGVDEVVPLVTEHCENRAARSARQLDRWQRVLLAACKQCVRVRPPTLYPPISLASFLALPLVAQADSRLLCQEHLPAPACAPWRTSPPACGSAVMLLGPEGGFSPVEQDAARAAGFVPVSLAPRVLRAETAAIVAATLGLMLLGRLDGSAPSPTQS